MVMVFVASPSSLKRHLEDPTQYRSEKGMQMNGQGTLQFCSGRGALRVLMLPFTFAIPNLLSNSFKLKKDDGGTSSGSMHLPTLLIGTRWQRFLLYV